MKQPPYWIKNSIQLIDQINEDKKQYILISSKEESQIFFKEL